MSEALLIVDYQNDFTPPEGALAVPEGDRIVELINAELGDDRYEVVIATRDWHPPDHSSFEHRGGPWPEHCVRDTEGAELHPELDHERIDIVFDKGTSPETEGYSAFESGELARILRERGIERVRVAGLATDYCVRHSALDALDEGFEVEVITEAVRGVDPDEAERALTEIERAGGSLSGRSRADRSA